ncbi:MAG: hypothetical protein ACQEVA_13075 [Myxococcota bacterium]
MKKLIRVMIALSVLGVGLTLSSTAFAQDGVINLEESVIKGRIQKPEAFYILQPANLDYEALDATPSFIDALLETVEEEPF